MRWSHPRPADDAAGPADGDPRDVEDLFALLDTVSARVDTLDQLVGEDAGAQENRTIHRGRAHLARSEARQVREEVAEVRRRARVVAARARAARPGRAGGPAPAEVPIAARPDLGPDAGLARPAPEERLVEQARHVDASVRWVQLCLPSSSGLRTWSSGTPVPEVVAAVEEGPRAAVLAGADVVVVNETDEHWAAVRAAAGRCGLSSVLGLAVPGTSPRAALVLASSQEGAFVAGTPGREVAELFLDHAARTLRGETGAEVTEEREVLAGARAVLGRHLGIGSEATFDALLEVARAADEPVVTAARRLVADLVPVAAGVASPEPAQLRHAVAYIHENVTRAVGLEDIARHAGVGDRRLQQLFRRHRGCSPLEYLRRVRLDHAHEELEALDPTSGTTVADVAARWRFTHPGRFSVVYRQRFGHSPSATLRS